MKVCAAFVCALAFAGLVAASSSSSSSSLPNQITDLPGAPTLNFNQYSGYVTVDEAHGRNLFYWYVESQGNPDKDPIVLWLNGGPGCSSLGGLLTENGPFWPKEDGTLYLNPYSWNRVANVVYLESPAGVGFSYSDNVSDYNTGDVQTADDAYTFLDTFFDMYPSLQGREFWITGESYGGHYVPELAAEVIYQNNSKINFKGFMAGNAWTVPKLDNEGCVFDWWSHALNSYDTYMGVMNNCNFSDIGPLAASPTGDDCMAFIDDAMMEMGNINIYDIYQYMCGNPLLMEGEYLLRAIAEGGSGATSALARGMLKQRERAVMAAAEANKAEGVTPAPPCLANWVQDYLNTPAVQEAIHANTTLGYQWTDCSPRVNYNYADVLTSVLPLYQDPTFRSQDVSILIYSGDVDAIVPTPGTRSWLSELDLTTKEHWRPWEVDGHQVGGYVVEYNELTFAVVRDAGHMVPGTQPERAFHMFSHFLNGEPF